MKKLTLAAIGLTGILASCNTPGGYQTPDYIRNDAVEIRTNLIDSATGQPISCRKVVYPNNQINNENFVVAEFGATGFNRGTLELNGDISLSKAVKQFNMADLQQSTRGNYLVQYVIDGSIVPASVSAQAIETKLAYKYVSPSGTTLGRFNATVTVTDGVSSDAATTSKYIPVYSSCIYRGEAPSLD
ncbi:hypothetical protein [Deinococcus sp.]|uniref:hypothetical protein n=1 Tax=Deinococcus sp. TaxID=47478 RepID=UPI0025C14912|nr:hypothetical protein [Deinococcus sp.]